MKQTIIFTIICVSLFAGLAYADESLFINVENSPAVRVEGDILHAFKEFEMGSEHGERIVYLEGDFKSSKNRKIFLELNYYGLYDSEVYEMFNNKWKNIIFSDLIRLFSHKEEVNVKQTNPKINPYDPKTAQAYPVHQKQTIILNMDRAASPLRNLPTHRTYVFTSRNPLSEMGFQKEGLRYAYPAIENIFPLKYKICGIFSNSIPATTRSPDW